MSECIVKDCRHRTERGCFYGDDWMYKSCAGYKSERDKRIEEDKSNYDKYVQRYKKYQYDTLRRNLIREFPKLKTKIKYKINLKKVICKEFNEYIEYQGNIILCHKNTKEVIECIIDKEFYSSHYDIESTKIEYVEEVLNRYKIVFEIIHN